MSPVGVVIVASVTMREPSLVQWLVADRTSPSIAMEGAAAADAGTSSHNKARIFFDPITAWYKPHHARARACADRTISDGRPSRRHRVHRAVQLRVREEAGRGIRAADR